MSSNELFEVRRRRHVGEINIVPILDMLTIIIFFLLISASFLQYNKISIPPAKTSLVESVEGIPLQLKLLLVKSGAEQKLLMFWNGAKPGSMVQNFALTATPKEIATKAREFAIKFKSEYKDESTIQLGLGANVSYGNLVSLMDAVRSSLPSVVLVSYQDTQIASDQFLGAGSQ